MAKYRVLAVEPRGQVLGHGEGDEFEADLPPDQEERMIARGAIEKVTASKRREKKDDAPSE